MNLNSSNSQYISDHTLFEEALCDYDTGVITQFDNLMDMHDNDNVVAVLGITILSADIDDIENPNSDYPITSIKYETIDTSINDNGELIWDKELDSFIDHLETWDYNFDGTKFKSDEFTTRNMFLTAIGTVVQSSDKFNIMNILDHFIDNNDKYNDKVKSHVVLVISFDKNNQLTGDFISYTVKAHFDMSIWFLIHFLKWKNIPDSIDM